VSDSGERVQFSAPQLMVSWRQRRELCTRLDL
jgi:hypothetical protein